MLQSRSNSFNLGSLIVMSQRHQGICKVFESGKNCKFGKDCKYLHFRKPKLHFDRHYNDCDGELRGCSTPYFSEEGLEEFSASSSAHKDQHDLRDLSRKTHTQADIVNRPGHRRCKFYASGFCAKGERCSFLHTHKHNDARPVAREVRQSHDEKEERTQPGFEDKTVEVCYHFRRGFCRYGDSCKWSHELPVIVAQDDQTEENATGKDVGTIPTDPTSRHVTPSPALFLEFPIEELNTENNHVLRDKEMVYFKKRFPKAEAVGDGIFKFVFRPSDPDWPYDVRCLNMRVEFPVAYPTKPVTVTLTDNAQLPETVQRYIWKTVEEWLNERFVKFEKKGKAELVMRAFVRWLDRSLEEIFTEGLKAYQRELVAKAAGIEFVPAAQLREEFAKRQSDSDASQPESDDEADAAIDSDDATDSDSDEDIENDLLMVNPNHSDGLEAAKRGTEVKLQSLQLKEQASSLVADRVALIVQCGRCKNKTEFETPPGRINVFGCAKCGQEQLVTFRANLAHQLTSIIGYLDLKECSIQDMILSECNFKVGCMECGRDMNFGSIMPGQMKESWCRSCHAKIVIAAESAKFFNLQPTQLDAAGAVQLNIKKLKIPKDPAIRAGFPLPDEGTCKHYKKSYRWLRFPCCGKAYPCDTCHDDNESHESVWANRMICGFCCKEQPFAADRPCVACSSSLTKKASTHWEGGKGCRDKIKMSRNDEAKYKNMNKTVSRKSQAKTSSTKTTKLRHS